jgi:dihydroorotate dehydrogenase
MSLAKIGFALAKPFLHQLDAERAHSLTIAGLKTGLIKSSGPQTHSSLRTTVFGLNFPNPLGLAPGFDKNADVPDAVLGLGFGFTEIGTVTPLPQAGNPKPRLFRLREDCAVINRMGFNNDGSGVVRQRLEARKARGGIVGINIGANKDSADRLEDYVKGVQCFAELASYITINISSPNTPGLRSLQGLDDLRRLLERINKVRPAKLPMLLKIAPDLNPIELQDIAAACGGGSVDGVIISNTTISRPSLKSTQSKEAGGLSGLPLFDLSTRMLSDFYQLTGGRIPLVGVGGVHDAETAFAKIQAGASLIQLYSALVFKGPGLIAEICDGLTSRLAASNFKTIKDAVGTQKGAAGR